MEVEKVYIIDWKIENFSCWNLELHGKCITSPKTAYNESIMKLYPKGTSGLETHMVVHFCNQVPIKDLSGALLFVGSNGSHLFSQKVQCPRGKLEFKLPPGPKFEEVILNIRENQLDHVDQLTLLLLLKREYNGIINIFTKIDVFPVYLELSRFNIVRNRFPSLVECIHDDFITIFQLAIYMIEEEKIELTLQQMKNNKFPYSVQTHLRSISEIGSLLKFENNEHLFHSNEHWKFSNSFTMKELSENAIMLRLKFISGKVSNRLVALDYNNVKYVPNFSLSGQDNSRLSEVLNSLFRNHGFSDVQVKCGCVSFQVHKNILSARSPVFKKLLLNDSEESVSGIVEIKDLDAETLSRFLTFIYTGTVGQDLKGRGAFELYDAAVKYQVPSLKKICVHFLIANVSASNACDVLTLGDQHQDCELLYAAHNFILRNFNEFLKSPEWLDFLSRQPLLAVKTLSDFAGKGYVGNLNTL